MAVILSGGLLSCTTSSSEEESSFDLGEAKHVVSMLSEEPIQLTQEQYAFACSNNRFTLNFLKTVNEADQSGKSFIYSPLSVTYVLGMVNDAATGQTEKELEQTLGFQEGGIQAVNDYCKKLIEGLPKVDNKVTLNIANALFVNKNRATLKSQYQQDMLDYYDAKAENLDFTSSSALNTINGWASDHTNNMIPKILDNIDPSVVTYLLNAIYFKADWASKFDQKNTREESFTTDKGLTKLPLMHQKVLINYLKNDTYSAVEMPYSNGYWNGSAFTSDGKWLVYRGTNGGIYLNGNAQSATASYYTKITNNNEVRFDVNTKPSTNIALAINWKWSDSTSEARINRYTFYNGGTALTDI
jgi:serpin B